MALVKVQKELVLRGGRLEPVVQNFARPAYLIKSGKVEIPESDPWAVKLAPHRETIERVIPAVGKLEVSGDPTLSYFGTAFLVGHALALTTSHVARGFAKGVGDQNIEPRTGSGGNKLEIRVNFKAEAESEESLRVKVAKVRFIHPWFDVALLELDAHPEGVAPCRLAGKQPDKPGGRAIAVVGYPAFDFRSDSDNVSKIFGDIFEVKRLMPGETMPPFKKSPVESLAHDASTLGGTAGAPIVDLKTGEVLGINFAGEYLIANYGVPAWELARDPWVRRHAVEFSDGVLPHWLHLWRTTEEEAPVAEKKSVGSDLPAEKPTDVALLAFDDLAKIHALLIDLGFTGENQIATLFNGMPPEFLAGLRRGSTVSETLYNQLHDLNKYKKIFQGHTPMYILLSNALAVKGSWATEAQELKIMRELIIKKENSLDG